MASLPDPQPGLVIGYAYLWRDEIMRGRDESAKDRPCVIVVSVRREAGEIVVTVAPVTHAEPRNPRFALELPSAVKRRLDLDDQRSWIILNDFNQFIWPGHDLRLTGRNRDTFVYGALPANLYRQLRDQVLALFRAGPVQTTYRGS